MATISPQTAQTALSALNLLSVGQLAGSELLKVALAKIDLEQAAVEPTPDPPEPA